MKFASVLTFLLGFAPLAVAQNATEDAIEEPAGANFTRVDVELELTERILEISVVSGLLSAMAYDDAELYRQEDGSFAHPDYEEIKFYTEEPDQAIVARKDGRCYLAFRGTNANLADWSQNINLGDASLHQDNDETKPACEGRAGFSDFLGTQVVIQGRADLQTCYDRCEDKMDCIVLTGHSQGGATATQASILLHAETPQVVTFGQPPAVDAGCEFIPSERFYRYVNSKQEKGEDDDIGFDPVVFSPNWVSKSVQYGYFILLGEDTKAVKVLGLDQKSNFVPSLFDRQNEISAHTMSGEGIEYSYLARVQALQENFPVSTVGFSDGVLCERTYAELCASERCGDNNQCIAKLDDLCVKESCSSDFDCFTDKCIYGACAASSGIAEIGCPCRFDAQCSTGECDQSLTSLDWTCYNTTRVSELCVPNSCSNDQQCESGKCIYGGCAMLKDGKEEGIVELGCPCFRDRDCVSGQCDQGALTLGAFRCIAASASLWMSASWLLGLSFLW